MGKATDLCEGILGTLWRHSPVTASFLGIHEYDHQFASFSPDALSARTVELGGHLREIEAFRLRREIVGDDERLDLELVETELKTLIRQEELRIPFRNPGSYLEDATYGLYLLLMRDFAPIEERVRAAASRLSAVPTLLEEARRNLSHPAEVPPLWASMSKDLTASAQEFFGEMVSWVRAGAPGLLPEFERASQRAREAVDEYESFLAEKIRPDARGSFAVGKEMFEFLLRIPHGLPYTCADIEAFGRSEVEQTLRQLEEAAATGGKGRHWEEVVESCRAEVPPADRLVFHYQQEIARARRFLKERDLVGFPPGETLRVVETPVFERKTTPFAAYIPPAPFEEKQEGYFWVTPPDSSLPAEERARQLQGHLLPSIPITSVHEGYPGHHLQISRANRVASKPRRQIWTPVMVEGWALYCEEMMGEQGFYPDPRTHILQLKDHLWRSCRVVIDVGLHTGTMSYEEAVQMLVKIPRLERHNAVGEVKRYSKTPTQPLSYAVGKREILSLRAELRKAEGPSFSLRRFHDRLLQYGSIPIGLIRERLLPAAHA